MAILDISLIGAMRMTILCFVALITNQNANTMIRDYMVCMVAVYASSVGASVTGRMNHTIMRTASKKKMRSVTQSEDKSTRNTVKPTMGESARIICFMMSTHGHGNNTMNRPDAHICAIRRMGIARSLGVS